MRKLRVGVWIQYNLLPEAGGAHGYYNELLKDIVDVKEKAAAVKEIVTDNMETIQSINDVFMIVSKKKI